MIKSVPKVHMVEMEELLTELQPHIDAIKATINKNLKDPHDFIIYPLLWASVMLDQCGDDVEQAKVNHSTMTELAILAYFAMLPDSRPEAIDLAKLKPPGGKAH